MSKAGDRDRQKLSRGALDTRADNARRGFLLSRFLLKCREQAVVLKAYEFRNPVCSANIGRDHGPSANIPMQ